MGRATLGTISLAVGAMAVAISTIPYVLSPIDNRRRDNGLAVLLLVSSVSVWNLMLLVQLLGHGPVSAVIFLALLIVGAVLSGFGWRLFATTASSTVGTFDRRGRYAGMGGRRGLDIAPAVTTAVHTVY